MMYFAVARDGHDGGAQITASHNPKEYNGIKMVRREAFPLSGEAGHRRHPRHDRRRHAAAAGGDAAAALSHDGRRRRLRQARACRSSIPSIIKPFNVVLDAGSGMAGLVAPKLFERLPCRTTTLCFEVDGTFPNHEANPLIEENRRDIVERVIAEKADIGIAWDGDADRCFFIDGSRRVHRRRLRHGAARRGVPAQASGREDRLRRARQLRGQGHRREVRRRRR